MNRYLLKATLILTSAGFLVAGAASLIGAVRHADEVTPFAMLLVLIAIMIMFGAIPFLVWSAFAWAACSYDRTFASFATFLFGLFVSGVGLWGTIYFTCIGDDPYWFFLAMTLPIGAGQTLMCVLGFIWIVIALDEMENPR
ncbi:MAG TPA: hypothetical protein VFE62_18015 [Gemmataceae bacterium]|nr:hypothetical protein [Gemmataceae bacterium]